MTQLESGPLSGLETEPPVARVRRSRSDRVVGGVCGGLGTYLGVDPLWFRLAFVLLAIGGGAGVLLYLLAWAIIPEQGENEAPEARAGSLVEDGPVIAGIGLIGAGLLFLFNTIIPWFHEVVWPVLVIVAGIGLLYVGSRRDHT